MADVASHIRFTRLNQLDTQGGKVMHGLRADEDEYAGFGEAYFSTVRAESIKGWKLHTRMVSNLVVVFGQVRFVFFDQSFTSPKEWVLDAGDNYGRLTVPPGFWMAFQGMASGESIILNVANIGHDPDEVQNRNLDDIPYTW